eukprot:8663059-Pyramimonas_sp.AAC.1
MYGHCGRADVDGVYVPTFKTRYANGKPRCSASQAALAFIGASEMRVAFHLQLCPSSTMVHRGGR